MARRSSALEVLLNGRHVGGLSPAANGAIDFRYRREWLDWENAIPVSLSLPLDTLRYTGAAVTAVFDNLLPTMTISAAALPAGSGRRESTPIACSPRSAATASARSNSCPKGRGRCTRHHRGRAGERQRRRRCPAQSRARAAGAPGGRRVPHIDRRCSGEDGAALVGGHVAQAARDHAHHAHPQTSDRRVAERHRPVEQRRKRASVPHLPTRAEPPSPRHGWGISVTGRC